MAKKGATKELILNAAIDIVGAESIMALSITRLSKETGLSKSLVMYHFKTIPQIIESAFIYAVSKGANLTDQRVDQADSFIDKINAIIEAAYEWVTIKPAFGDFFILVYHLATKSETLSQVHHQMMETGIKRIKFLIYENCNYDKEEVEKMALSIHSNIIGSIIRMVSLNEVDKKDSYILSAKNVVQKTISPTVSFL